MHDNAVHGAFTVQGNTIVDNYTIENGKMKVEFFSIKLEDKKQVAMERKKRLLWTVTGLAVIKQMC